MTVINFLKIFSVMETNLFNVNRTLVNAVTKTVVKKESSKSVSETLSTGIVQKSDFLEELQASTIKS